MHTLTLLPLSLLTQCAAVMGASLPDSYESRTAQVALSSVHCIKGALTAVVGDVWRLQYHTPAVGWDYPLSDTNKLR